MHVLVVTCAHRGDDARISHRQIVALLDAGHSVTLVAPEPTPFERERFRHVVVPRAVGRRRRQAWSATRRAVRAHASDVLVVHDIELLPVIPRRSGALVWDVHEDYSAAVADRAWLPRLLRAPARWFAVVAERIASRRYTVILAEESYRSRHPDAPVVPNTTVVPDTYPAAEPDARRVVYLGRISRSRGLSELIELGRRLRGEFVVELIGAVDADDRQQLVDAAARSDVVWHGFVPNDAALGLVDGALVGVSLLHAEPNFVHSMPTKLVEYLAHGVPVVSTRLPVATQLVEQVGGTVVDVGDVDAVERAVRALAADPAARAALAERGHRHVHDHANWTNSAREFVAILEAAAAR